MSKSNLFQNYVLVLMRSIRIHQWVKNLLLFLPMCAAYKLNDLYLFFQELLGFFAFSLCASGGYILNDLLDLSEDRRHTTKKFRPFAAEQMPLFWGWIAIPIFWIVSFIIAVNVSLMFVLVLFIYLLSTISYSIWLKRLLLIDVITLSMLYIIRIIAGGVIGGIPISEWLLAFSMFLFLSLAIVKRVSELQQAQQKAGLLASNRGYLPSDLASLVMLGSCSGYITILVFALYINSPTVINLYHTPQILWFCCPLLLYWISRIWILTDRHQMNDDPVVFALKDKQSYVVIIIFCFLLFLAR